MFHVDVAKVDQDVAYIAIHMLQVFVPNVSTIFFQIICKCVYLDACICFTHMLQVFYIDVAYVCNCFSSVFHVFQTHVSYVCCNCFI
jgi:hypothetical protein